MILLFAAQLAFAGPTDEYKYEMVSMEPGSFVMGDPSPSSKEAAYYAQHEVRITQPFAIGRTEVTRDLWFSIMDKEGPGIGIKKVEGGTTISLNVFGGGTSRSKCKADKCPVVGPDWYDAVRFCNKLSELEGLEPAYEIIERHPEPGVSWNRNANGYRLPTEAEFEYAARAGTQQTYAGSDDIWEVADAGNKAVAVGQNKPNAWGLHGMTGNVWEWTWDWFGPYSGGTAVDPAGPARGRAHQEITGQVKPMRVTRGGSVTIIPAPKGVRARWVTVWRRQTEFPYCEWTVKTGLRLVRNL